MTIVFAYGDYLSIIPGGLLVGSLSPKTSPVLFTAIPASSTFHTLRQFVDMRYPKGWDFMLVQGMLVSSAVVAREF
ncbi:MAG: hypothetical protein GY703_13395 [Gammaproteobacteria bacterium]|nr:hypothetical protein [Gammaproteobacteria bacterium]